MAKKIYEMSELKDMINRNVFDNFISSRFEFNDAINTLYKDKSMSVLDKFILQSIYGLHEELLSFIDTEANTRSELATLRKDFNDYKQLQSQPQQSQKPQQTTKKLFGIIGGKKSKSKVAKSNSKNKRKSKSKGSKSKGSKSKSKATKSKKGKSKSKK